MFYFFHCLCCWTSPIASVLVGSDGEETHCARNPIQVCAHRWTHPASPVNVLKSRWQTRKCTTYTVAFLICSKTHHPSLFWEIGQLGKTQACRVRCVLAWPEARAEATNPYWTFTQTLGCSIKHKVPSRLMLSSSMRYPFALYHTNTFTLIYKHIKTYTKANNPTPLLSNGPH